MNGFAESHAQFWNQFLLLKPQSPQIFAGEGSLEVLHQSQESPLACDSSVQSGYAVAYATGVYLRDCAACTSAYLRRYTSRDTYPCERSPLAAARQSPDLCSSVPQKLYRVFCSTVNLKPSSLATLGANSLQLFTKVIVLYACRLCSIAGCYTDGLVYGWMSYNNATSQLQQDARRLAIEYGICILLENSPTSNPRLSDKTSYMLTVVRAQLVLKQDPFALYGPTRVGVPNHQVCVHTLPNSAFSMRQACDLRSLRACPLDELRERDRSV